MRVEHIGRIVLNHVSAALNADPFADPVSVKGSSFSRKYARRLERELTAKFSARPVGSHAGDRPNDDASNPSPAAPLSASLPESVSAPNREALSGSLFNHLHG